MPGRPPQREPRHQGLVELPWFTTLGLCWCSLFLENWVPSTCLHGTRQWKLVPGLSRTLSHGPILVADFSLYPSLRQAVTMTIKAILNSVSPSSKFPKPRVTWGTLQHTATLQGGWNQHRVLETSNLDGI